MSEAYEAARAERRQELIEHVRATFSGLDEALVVRIADEKLAIEEETLDMLFGEMIGEVRQATESGHQFTGIVGLFGDEPEGKP